MLAERPHPRIAYTQRESEVQSGLLVVNAESRARTNHESNAKLCSMQTGIPSCYQLMSGQHRGSHLQQKSPRECDIVHSFSIH